MNPRNTGVPSSCYQGHDISIVPAEKLTEKRDKRLLSANECRCEVGGEVMKTGGRQIQSDVERCPNIRRLVCAKPPGVH